MMHSDWVVMLFAYLEGLGGNLRSLRWHFGRLGLLEIGWWVMRRYLKVLDSVALD